ncbi:MAG: response regulator transcription factor [Lachnospiraceae bacterium]|nr:response regulator transcription factor [Lachnospiraceae bacterium]
MGSILVCDDDKEIVEAISIYLTSEGYDVVKAYDGIEAINVFKSNAIDLILIDIMMPKLDGIRTIMKLREENNVPIIVLSAKSEDTDKVLGLNVGADDYITKPFNPLELVARVKSQLRRYTTFNNAPVNKSESILSHNGLELNDDQKLVTLYGEEIKLTPIEYSIIKLFLENPGIVFSSSQIYENIWDEDAVGSDNIVAVHIRHIREKIEVNPKEPRFIKVVWGQGYKLEI